MVWDQVGQKTQRHILIDDWKIRPTKTNARKIQPCPSHVNSHFFTPVKKETKWQKAKISGKYDKLYLIFHFTLNEKHCWLKQSLDANCFCTQLLWRTNQKRSSAGVENRPIDGSLLWTAAGHPGQHDYKWRMQSCPPCLLRVAPYSRNQLFHRPFALLQIWGLDQPKDWKQYFVSNVLDD